MMDCRFMRSGATKGIAALVGAVLVSGTAFAQCDTSGGGTEEADAGFCGPGVDPNGGCNEDPEAWQDLGTISNGGSLAAFGTMGGFVDDTDPKAPVDSRDLDWYSFATDSPGTLTFTINADRGGAGTPADVVLFVVDSNGGDCGAFTFQALTPVECGQEVQITVPAGNYGFITSTAFGEEGGGACSTDYRVSVSLAGASDVCGDPGSGECTDPNGVPGCSDLTCCATVCEIDSFCCDEAWDESCVAIAVDACGIFVYECTDPAIDNDCATNATVVDVSGGAASFSFDSTGANTDGPDQPECGSGVGNEPIYNDHWYVVTAPGDGFLTASTCEQTEYDTKIAVYNVGDYSSFDPTQLENLFVGCNEDCGDIFFASEIVLEVEEGTDYLIRIGGFVEGVDSGPGDATVSFDPLPSYECTSEGDVVTQSADQTLADGGVACAGGGITTENQYARSFDFGGDVSVDCADFGFENTGSTLLGSFNVYIDDDGGAPLAPGIDLSLIESLPIAIPGGVLGSVVVSYETAVDAPSGSRYVFEVDLPASSDGFASPGTNDAGEDEPTYLRSGACGINEFVTYEAIGFAGLHWVLNVTLNGGGGPDCTGDINGDNVVNGADLTILLGAFNEMGDNPADLNGDMIVNGADLTILLGAFGDCP